MDKKQVCNNGITVTYAVHEGRVIIFHPVTGVQAMALPLDQPPDQLEGGFGMQSTESFRSCMKGCYDPKHGSPAELAGCIALCSTILFSP
jgi:hypothetical protein